MKFRTLSLVLTVGHLAYGTAFAEKPANMPQQDYAAMLEAAARSLDLPVGSTVNFNWRSPLGHSGEIAPYPSFLPQSATGAVCRTFDAPYVFRVSGNRNTARLRGSVCRLNGRTWTRNLNVIEGIIPPGVGASPPPPQPPPLPPPPAPITSDNTTEYTNELGHSCYLTVTTTISGTATSTRETRSCVSEAGSRYDDVQLPPAPPDNPYENESGDDCVEKAETVVMDGRKQRRTTRECESWLGGSYADGDAEESGGDTLEAIIDYMDELLYWSADTGRMPGRADLKRIAEQFIEDNRLDGVDLPSELLAALEEAAKRSSDLPTASCDLLDRSDEEPTNENAQACVEID